MRVVGPQPPDRVPLPLLLAADLPRCGLQPCTSTCWFLNCLSCSACHSVPQAGIRPLAVLAFPHLQAMLLVCRGPRGLPSYPATPVYLVPVALPVGPTFLNHAITQSW